VNPVRDELLQDLDPFPDGNVFQVWMEEELDEKEELPDWVSGAITVVTGWGDWEPETVADSEE